MDPSLLWTGFFVPGSRREVAQRDVPMQEEMNHRTASPEVTPVPAPTRMLARRDREVALLLSRVAGGQHTLALLGLLL